MSIFSDGLKIYLILNSTITFLREIIMQHFQLSESTRNVISSRLRETLSKLKAASQTLSDAEENPLSSAEKYAIVIEALQFVIRNRDTKIDPPQNYAKGHQLLSDVDLTLETMYENPTSLDLSLQGQSLLLNQYNSI